MDRYSKTHPDLIAINKAIVPLERAIYLRVPGGKHRYSDRRGDRALEALPLEWWMAAGRRTKEIAIDAGKLDMEAMNIHYAVVALIKLLNKCGYDATMEALYRAAVEEPQSLPRIEAVSELVIRYLEAPKCTLSMGSVAASRAKRIITTHQRDWWQRALDATRGNDLYCYHTPVQRIMYYLDDINYNPDMLYLVRCKIFDNREYKTAASSVVTNLSW